MDVSAETARRKVAAADHILTQTYPLVKDPKLLVAVLQNLVDGLDAALGLALGKRAPEEFSAKLSLFLKEVAPVWGIRAADIRFVAELRETLHEHETSPVEFVRESRFVICDDDYRLRTLSEERMKGYVQSAKGLVRLIEGRTQA